MSKWPRLLVPTLLLCLLAPGGSVAAQSKVVSSGRGTCREIALTYDVEFGPSTQALIDTIDALGIRTTWFFLGSSVGAHPDLVKQVARNHEIGNHTYSHPQMPRLSGSGMHQQFSLGAERIQAVSGIDPQPYWRPPYGEYSNAVLQVAEDEGYPFTVMWSIDTRDWSGPSAETIRRRIVDGAFPGAISLQHGSPPNTVEGTRLAVADLRARGYQFVTVSEILGVGRNQRDFGGDTYVVQSGDTWEDVAKCHNVTGPRLQAYNSGAALTAGTVLQIPHMTEVVIRVDSHRIVLPVYPRTVDDRTLAHIRVAERLGGTVSWDGARVIITKGSKRVEITPDQRTALVNGLSVDMGTSARWIDDRILVPVRFLAEHLAYQMAWDEPTFTLSLFQ